MAEILTNKVVVISAKNFVNDFPKYPINDPSNGKIILRIPFSLSCREYPLL